MRTIITNATTREGEKFRKVRLSNAKIAAAIVDVGGALDLMMSVGFVPSEGEEDKETYLVLPPEEKGPAWLPEALACMESCIDSSK
mmetsp:Transcript_33123/g.51271  ORF Transcript_33123/g.51271 Transcript_33123/m.51271 type:complete len:86 (-) Transcript_33123:295-552(-)